MDAITTRVYHGVKSYWRRRRYERLGGGGGSENHRRRRFWRIRITTKLKLKLKRKLKVRSYSPKKLLIGIRDRYVNMMMRMASSPAMVAGAGGYGEGVAKFGVAPVKEYDEKLIIEIYKTLAMRQPPVVANGGSEIGGRR